MIDVTGDRDVVFRRPAVVVSHGGAWIEGEKGQLEALERALAERGSSASTRTTA